MEALANVNQYGLSELREDELMMFVAGSRMSYDFGQWLYEFTHPEPKDYRDDLIDRLSDTGKGL